MTNAEYIMSRMTDRDLAELYANCLSYSFNKNNLNKKVINAFHNWQRDTDKPNRNFTVEGEPDPSVWEWHKIFNHKTGNWENRGRSNMVAFQQWLCFQYDEKHWKEVG